MIRYTLRCRDGHEFEGWFRSSDGFDALRLAGQVACTHCGSTAVEKAPMAPAVPSDRANRGTSDRAAPERPPTMAQRVEQSLAELRRQVEANSDYVGMRFVQEARAMHEGRLPERAIHGEARVEDARKLIEDGVPVAPLPFRRREGMN